MSIRLVTKFLPGAARTARQQMHCVRTTAVLARMVRPATFSRLGAQITRPFSTEEEEDQEVLPLADMLDRELAEAEADENTLNSNTEEVNDFAMSKTDDVNLVFSKEVEGESITITVNTSDQEENHGEDEMDDEDMEAENSEDEEPEHEPEEGQLGANCVINFAKGEQSMSIHAVAWSNGGFDITHIAQGTDNEYTGPKVDQLDEGLVDSFHDYMAERGLDDVMATHIVEQSFATETKCYAGWLRNLQSYVAK